MSGSSDVEEGCVLIYREGNLLPHTIHSQYSQSSMSEVVEEKRRQQMKPDGGNDPGLTRKLILDN